MLHADINTYTYSHMERPCVRSPYDRGGGGGVSRSLSGVVGILGGSLANPQAYAPYWVRPTPTPDESWALQAAARAAPFPSRAGCDRADGTRGSSPRRV